MQMKTQLVNDNIIWIDFDEKAELGKTFLRFQEFYEGPEHAGKKFTVAEYEIYYADKYGEFSYYTDWSGFNVPSYVIETFAAGGFGPYSVEESLFLSEIKKVKRTATYYVIGTYKGKLDVLKHELAHALFYLDSQYRAEVLKVLGRINMGKLFQVLEDTEYNSVTWVDEVHAYLLDAADEAVTFLPDHGIEPSDYLDTIVALTEIYERYEPHVNPVFS